MENNIQTITDPQNNSIQYIFEINKNIYSINALITNGTYGPIACFNKKDENDKEVTIKKICDAYDSPDKGRNIITQLAILCFLNHENIVQLKNIYIPENDNWKNLYLIEEYMDTNLERFILSDFDFTENEITIPWIIYQILLGLFYLHSSKITHRNIKPSNILIDSECNIKICGFNNARSFGDYENTLKGEINNFVEEKGILSYRAPEFLASKKKNNYDEKIDIWGVGCIMAELYTKKYPFFSLVKVNNKKPNWYNQLQSIFYKLGKPSKEELEEFCSKERIKDIGKIQQFQEQKFSENFPGINDKNTLDLLQKLLCINPNKRITIKEAGNHPYFDVIKKYKTDDDFQEVDEVYNNYYGPKIEQMEKNNPFFNEKIEYYKKQMEYLCKEVNKL